MKVCEIRKICVVRWTYSNNGRIDVFFHPIIFLHRNGQLTARRSDDHDIHDPSTSGRSELFTSWHFTTGRCEKEMEEKKAEPWFYRAFPRDTKRPESQMSDIFNGHHVSCLEIWLILQGNNRRENNGTMHPIDQWIGIFMAMSNFESHFWSWP